jgi:hypothetical protein
MLLNMESSYLIVTMCVIWTSWAHVWRLRSRYLGTGYDNWYQSCVDCRTPAYLEQSLLRTSIFQIICQNYHLTLIPWFYKTLWSHTLLFLNVRWLVPAASHTRALAVYPSVSWHLGTCRSLKSLSPTVIPRVTKTLKKVINKWLGTVMRLNQKANFKNKVSDSNYHKINPNFFFKWNSKFWSFFGKKIIFPCNKV